MILTIEGHPATGSENNNARITMNNNAHNEIKKKTTPNTEAANSGAVEYAKIPSIA